MNSPKANRFNVAVGTATATSGMRVAEDGYKNRAVFGGDRYPRVWPCKKDHPFYRVRMDEKGRPYCRECELENKRKERGKSE